MSKEVEAMESSVNEVKEEEKTVEEGIRLELTKVKTNLIDSNNTIADNSCVYCLEFMRPRFTVQQSSSHSNFHMKCAMPDLERR